MSKSQQERLVMIIEGLTPSGQAFVVHKGKKLVFNGFLPGDKIEILFTEKGKAVPGELLEPSPNRVKPDCYFHGPCGGCDLLELSEKARKTEKTAMISRCLEKIDGGDKAFVHNFLAAKELIRYRPKMRLHQGRNYDERESGFLASEKFFSKIPGGIVPITACAIVTKPLAKRIVAARKILSQIPICLESLQLMSSSSARSDRVAGHATMMKGKTPRFFRKDLEKVMRACQLKGLSISDHTGKIKEVIGTVGVTGLIAPDVEGGPFEAEPAFFVQANIHQNTVLIRKVVELCKPKPGVRIVEGFAGAGNFTFALAAKGALVEAVESHPGAFRSAEKNISNVDYGNRITFIKGDAMKEMLNFEEKPDVLLIDPPRNGTSNIGKIVAKLQPNTIVNVFCDLDAMRKDSNNIIAQGYKLTEVSGIDLYPRTHHVEVVCKYEK